MLEASYPNIDYGAVTYPNIDYGAVTNNSKHVRLALRNLSLAPSTGLHDSKA